MIEGTELVARPRDVVVRTVGVNELMLEIPESGRRFRLTGLARALWLALDGSTSLSKVVDDLAHATALSNSEVDTHVNRFVAWLADNDLVDLQEG